MARELKNKVIVITGAAEGLGLIMAEVFLEKGAKTVVILDINEKLGADAARSLNSKYGDGKAAFFKCDVIADLETISKKLFDTYKTVDVLVNNAGILDDFAVKKTIYINVLALIEWSNKFWEHMRKDKGGKGGTIINLASIYGFRVDQFLPVYQASKFAVMGFTRSLGHKYNYERSGVRVVAICPGFTVTKLTTEVKASDEQVVQRDWEAFLKGNLWQKPESVGKAAAEIYERADSGTAWLIEGGKPIVEVPYVSPF
ncbi:15-hydroxyprostaglandin dehydrogenase [NAD(+)]-like [Galleria mellonella]|uniref:15-hydroxyprostaglandin dehydrogenase [NAD(+)]-like n=1 Tax=Galleria mellonella TaxID=7137 RepID=A0A6J1WH84_GALME|nr:15-hydroxyprostaglandin dehydrogenase [NAD(+)]-like [Galleria mellonella]